MEQQQLMEPISQPTSMNAIQMDKTMVPGGSVESCTASRPLLLVRVRVQTRMRSHIQERKAPSLSLALFVPLPDTSYVYCTTVEITDETVRSSVFLQPRRGWTVASGIRGQLTVTSFLPSNATTKKSAHRRSSSTRRISWLLWGTTQSAPLICCS